MHSALADIGNPAQVEPALKWNGASEFDLEVAIRDHAGTVAGLVQRLVDNPSDAAELVQDVFVIAVERQHLYRGDSAVSTWLCGIAIRVCRRWYRRQAVKRRCTQIIGWQRTEEQASHEDRADRVDLVHAVLGRLPIKEKEVLVLRYLRQHDIEEICAMLALTRAAVEKRLSRARRRFATEMAQVKGERP